MLLTSIYASMLNVFMGKDKRWSLVGSNTHVVQNLAENISSMKVFEI